LEGGLPKQRTKTGVGWRPEEGWPWEKRKGCRKKIPKIRNAGGDEAGIRSGRKREEDGRETSKERSWTGSPKKHRHLQVFMVLELWLEGDPRN
jgi:hypothetical protein